MDLSNKQLENTDRYLRKWVYGQIDFGSEIVLCNRKISTYINALAKSGFAIEQRWNKPMNEQGTQQAKSAAKKKSENAPAVCCV